MSTAYLFRFGYESPHQFRINRALGTDDESSAAFWIAGASEQEAVRWGQSVADRFVAWLFEEAGDEGYSWHEGQFANWIETEPSELAACHAAKLPVVVVGKEPSFEALAG